MNLSDFEIVLPMFSGTEFQWKSSSLEAFGSFSFWKWHVSNFAESENCWPLIKDAHRLSEHVDGSS